MSDRMIGLLIMSVQIAVIFQLKVPRDVRERYSWVVHLMYFLVIAAAAFVNLYVAMRALMLIGGWS